MVDEQNANDNDEKRLHAILITIPTGIPESILSWIIGTKILNKHNNYEEQEGEQHE